MWKAFARDVICMLSAVIVMTVIVAALWFAVALWLLPPLDENVWWIYAPFLAPVVVALTGVGLLLYVPLRGRARRGQAITPPYWRDTLIAPLLAGLALGLGFLLTALLTGHKARAAAACLLGLALTVPLELAAWLVVLVQRFTARPARTLSIAAAAFVTLWLGGRLVLDAWGGRIFAAYKAVALAEIAAERQRIAANRRPVLFGAAIYDNAADRYRRLTQTIADKQTGTTARLAIMTAVTDGPGKPRSAEVSHWVEVCQPDLQALREAVRCTRCDWRFAWEQGLAAPFPDFASARQAANLLVIEGYQRAEAGDVTGAVERDLEVIRMGSDYESSCALIGTLIAVALEADGTNALLRLVATDGLATPPVWDEVESALDLLEPRLASMSIGYRSERLAHVGWETITDDDRRLLGLPNLPRSLDLFFPGRFLVADSVRTQDELLREIEKANELADSREALRLSQAASERARRSRNFLVHVGLPSLWRARIAQDQETARFRMLRAAIRIEKTCGKGGPYPASAAAIDLPIDPFAYPAKLHYASLAEGRGYKLWSVGLNGTDEGGVAKDKADEVFERPTRTAPAVKGKRG
jgi:hypothetical protein